MLEKGPLTALLGGKDLLGHPSLQANRKVFVLKRPIKFETHERLMRDS